MEKTYVYEITHMHCSMSCAMAQRATAQPCKHIWDPITMISAFDLIICPTVISKLQSSFSGIVTSFKNQCMTNTEKVVSG